MGTIDVSQFDLDIFLRYYMLHPRPLLIRGGVKLPSDVMRSYTRTGLLEAAGDKKISTQRFPYEEQFDRSKPVKKNISAYIKSLEERSGVGAAKKLHYVYYELPKDEVLLNFSASMPEILAGKVEHTHTHFYLGGLYMGTPPHHHGPAVNSLVYGIKLWLFEP